MKKILLASLTIALCINTQGCATNSSVAKTTYTAGSSLRQIMDDNDITKTAYKKLDKNFGINSGNHIIVAVKNSRMLLAGQVTEPGAKTQIETMMRNIDGVRTIYNFISISGPSSDLVRSSDSWITAKIKSQLILAKNIPANHIKVVTENGVVYLMGEVNPDGANTAVDIARQVIGVQKVVKLFEGM